MLLARKDGRERVRFVFTLTTALDSQTTTIEAGARQLGASVDATDRALMQDLKHTGDAR